MRRLLTHLRDLILLGPEADRPGAYTASPCMTCLQPIWISIVPDGERYAEPVISNSRHSEFRSQRPDLVCAKHLLGGAKFCARFAWTAPPFGGISRSVLSLLTQGTGNHANTAEGGSPPARQQYVSALTCRRTAGKARKPYWRIGAQAWTESIYEPYKAAHPPRQRPIQCAAPCRRNLDARHIAGKLRPSHQSHPGPGGRPATCQTRSAAHRKSVRRCRPAPDR